MFVDTFITRPILATVCSLVIVLAGALAIPQMPIAQYPAGGATHCAGHGDLHRLQRRDGGDRRHNPARAGDQRCGGHALHVILEHQQRHQLDYRDVRRHARSRHSRGRRAEPRQPGAGPPAGGSPSAWRHRAEIGDELHPCRGGLFRAGRVRFALHLELHRRLHQGRAQARAWRRRRVRLRGTQVLDADLA